MKNFRNSILLIVAAFSVVALALLIGANVHGTAPVHGQSLAWGPLPPPDDDFVAIAWGPLPPPDDFIAWGPLPPPDDVNFVAWGPLPPPDDDFVSA